jgi:hypothetical protein
VAGAACPKDIANKFADHFKGISQINPVGTNTISATAVLDSIASYNVKEFLLNRGDIIQAVNKLKPGKAPGADNISCEHIKFANVTLMDHLCSLFNMILVHGYVPRSFGSGVMVPIIKDKYGDSGKLDNYRAITLSSIISKLFEICLLDKFGSYLVSYDLQLGFKANTGCSHAIYIMVQQVVKYFVKRGTTVYLSALDASKAFDRLDHNILVSKLLNRSVPVCFIKVVSNWYSKITATVRWNDFFSYSFSLSAGVRQGGVLSPILFNVYLDDIINNVETSGFGCHVRSKFFGAIVYADDILLISPSVAGLQGMLSICSDYGILHGIIFNASKSSCMKVGPQYRNNVTQMHISLETLPWVTEFKYLGVNFSSGKDLKFDCSFVKRKFYAAFNSLCYKCRFADEGVKVMLTKSYCLPMVTYCIGALDLSPQNISSLGVCWNDAFRKIYGMHRWESVALLQYFCTELPMNHLYDLYKWNFHYALSCDNYIPEPVRFFKHVIDVDCNVTESYVNKFSCSGKSAFSRKLAVKLVFETQCMVHL